MTQSFTIGCCTVIFTVASALPAQVPEQKAAASTDPGQQGVSTKSYDVTRSNLNSNETYFTADTVSKMATAPLLIPCIGDPRGCEGQPVVDESTKVGPVMMLPSEANIVRGVNPDNNGSAVWQTPQLCPPIRADSTVDMWGINWWIGMMGTGDADNVLHRYYQVATCSKDGSNRPASMEQRMLVLDSATGNVIASTPFVGVSDDGVDVTAAPRKQRAAILPWNFGGNRFKMVLMSTFAETGPQATGFLLAFDTYDNQFKAVISLGAGGWMSGQGPSMDPKTGIIFFGLGNGPYNGTTKFGEGILAMQFTPPTATTKASFKVLHSYALFSDDARTCRKVPVGNKVAGVSASSGVPGAAMPMAEVCDATWGDQDANLFCKELPDVHQLICGGKDGIAVVIDTNKFPDTKPADFANPLANCAKVTLLQPGYNLGMSSCPADPAQYNRFPGDKTRHLHSTPATYIDENGNHFELFMAENSWLQAWLVSPDGRWTFVARSDEFASAQATGMHGGMPGGFISVTSNRGRDGLAWVSIPDGDANRMLTTGHMSVFDLRGLLALNGTGKFIPRIWVSDTYRFSKFSTPIVRKGKAYLANYDGSIQQWPRPN